MVGADPNNQFVLPTMRPPPTPPEDQRKARFTQTTQQKGTNGVASPPPNGSDVHTSDSAFAHLREGPLVLRLARHPFASGTTEQTRSSSAALMMVHNSGLRYPKSIKLRKDKTGHWKVVHWSGDTTSKPSARAAEREWMDSSQSIALESVCASVPARLIVC